MPRTHTFPIICNWTDGTWTQENYDFPEIPDGKKPRYERIMARIHERLGENSPYQLVNFILTPAIDDRYNDEDLTYPHGDKYPIAPTVPGLYLQLWNGRRDYVNPNALEDCGFDGPCIGPLGCVSLTYGHHIKLQPTKNHSITHFWSTPNQSELQDMIINNDGYIEHEGCCYGDWTVYYHNGEPQCQNT